MVRSFAGTRGLTRRRPAATWLWADTPPHTHPSPAPLALLLHDASAPSQTYYRLQLAPLPVLRLFSLGLDKLGLEFTTPTPYLTSHLSPDKALRAAAADAPGIAPPVDGGADCVAEPNGGEGGGGMTEASPSSLSSPSSDKRGVYSFCMCPGGQVRPAREEGGG